MTKLTVLAGGFGLAVLVGTAATTEFRWRHLPTANGDPPLPNKGTEQPDAPPLLKSLFRVGYASDKS